MFSGSGHVLGKRPCSRETDYWETDNSETAMFSGGGQALVCDGARLPTHRKGPASPAPTGQYALYLLGSSEAVLLLLGPRLDA